MHPNNYFDTFWWNCMRRKVLNLIHCWTKYKLHSLFFSQKELGPTWIFYDFFLDSQKKKKLNSSRMEYQRFLLCPQSRKWCNRYVTGACCLQDTVYVKRNYFKSCYPSSYEILKFMKDEQANLKGKRRKKRIKRQGEVR